MVALDGDPSRGAEPHRSPCPCSDVLPLCRRLAGEGVSVQVLTRRDAPGGGDVLTVMPGVEVVRIAIGAPRPLSGAELVAHLPAISRVLRSRWFEAPPSVVHSHRWAGAFAAHLALRNLRRVPHVVTFHGLSPAGAGRSTTADDPRSRSALQHQLARSADHVIATTEDEISALGAVRGVAARLSLYTCRDRSGAARGEPDRGPDEPDCSLGGRAALGAYRRCVQPA